MRGKKKKGTASKSAPPSERKIEGKLYCISDPSGEKTGKKKKAFVPFPTKGEKGRHMAVSTAIALAHKSKFGKKKD